MSDHANAKENKMGTAPLWPLLITMALPLMISMLVQAMYNVVDSIFVSRINEAALTAVSAAFPIQSIMISVLGGTGVGINAILSRSLGEKNYKRANAAANNGTFLAICSYLVFVLIGLFVAKPFFLSQYTHNPEIVDYGVTYLRIVCVASFGFCFQMTYERMMQGAGLTFYTMITQSTGAIVNIILDPVLIFGLGPFPEMGVAGAAIATVTGQIIAGIMAVTLNQKINTSIHVTVKDVFRPSGEVIRRIYHVGVPSIIMMSIGSVMYYGMNRILTTFEDTASAVFGVYFKLQSFFFMPTIGMNNALVPIIAYNYGAQKRSRMIGVLKRAIIMAVCILSVGLLAFELLPQVLFGMFNASEHMLEIGVPAMRIIGLHFPVAAVCIILGTVFQALGQATYSAMVSIGRQLVVLLPAAFILSRIGGLSMIWWAFPIAEIMSMALTLIFFRRIYKTTISKVGDL